jgi:hypothetical protein
MPPPLWVNQCVPVVQQIGIRTKARIMKRVSGDDTPQLMCRRFCIAKRNQAMLTTYKESDKRPYN